MQVATLPAGDADSEALVRALGHVLRPEAPLSLLAAVAGDCARKGWVAALGQLLVSLRAAADDAALDAGAAVAADGGSKTAQAEAAAAAASAAVLLPDGATTLLHVAAAGGSLACCRAVLAAGPAFGNADSCGRLGLTPLHFAARHRPLLALLLRSGGAPARAAFASAADGHGRTPCDVATAAAAAAAEKEASYVASRKMAGAACHVLTIGFQLSGVVFAYMRRRRLPADQKWTAVKMSNPTSWAHLIGLVADPPGALRTPHSAPTRLCMLECSGLLVRGVFTSGDIPVQAFPSTRKPHPRPWQISTPCIDKCFTPSSS